METNHILLVEDDKEIREGVEIYLKSQAMKYSRRPMESRALRFWIRKRYIWLSWM